MRAHGDLPWHEIERYVSEDVGAKKKQPVQVAYNIVVSLHFVKPHQIAVFSPLSSPVWTASDDLVGVLY